MRTLTANRSMPNTGGWQDRHDAALRVPATTGIRKPFETALVEMLKGWQKYALDHKERYDRGTIGEDGILGPEWEAIGDALRGLLNGETGRLDCGTLDGFILDTMKENGIETENK
jgi:hypothetical protein